MHFIPAFPSFLFKYLRYQIERSTHCFARETGNYSAADILKILLSTETRNLTQIRDFVVHKIANK